MKRIEPGSADWTTLEDLIDRYGVVAVEDAVETIEEDLDEEGFDDEDDDEGEDYDPEDDADGLDE